MPASLPPLTWLRAFECSARHLSFTHAAQELNLTQSAVSQHVRALEDRLSAKLFHRKARGLALTEDGRRLLPHISGAIGDLARACERFTAQETAETLDIACATSFAILWLIPRLKGFRVAHPNIGTRISSTLWPDHNISISADVQIRFGSRELAGEGAELLFDDEICPICAPQFMAQVTAPNDLWALPLIHTVGTSVRWRDWANAAAAGTPPAPVHSVDSSVLAVELARAGNGAALASRFLCLDLLETGALCQPVNSTIPAVDGYFLAATDAGSKRTMVEAFTRWMKAEIEAALG